MPTKLAKSDYAVVKKILDRSYELNGFAGISLMMDLEFCNETVPLDFEKLLAFKDADFRHDILGIYHNFDRVTKTLGNCFLPRCAKAVK